jgi:hypothetical protein
LPVGADGSERDNRSMVELELVRALDDRRLYSLGDVGTLRLEGFFSRGATAAAGGRSWQISRHGFWQREIQAIDPAGTVVGEFVPRGLRRGGTITWAGEQFTLLPAGALSERYVLAADERDLALIEGKSWGKKPVQLKLVEHEPPAPGLLLFAAFVVRQLAVNAANAAAGGGTAAVAGSSS